MSNDPVLFSFFVEISIIDQLAGTMFDRLLPRGVTRAQFAVLNHFVRLGIDEKAPYELAAVLQVTRGTMTSTLGRMQRNGLILIEPDPTDGRGKLVSLTQHGKQVREDCISALQSLIEQLGPKLPIDRMLSALPVIREIRETLDSNRL